MSALSNGADADSLPEWNLHFAELRGLVPREVRHAWTCLRRRDVWLKHGVIFVHIPKAAGTSIAKALYGRSLGHVRAAEIARFCPDVFAQLPRFAVTRNPWDRLVSAYSFATQASSPDAGVWRPSIYKAPAFRSFESFVFEWLVEQDLTAIDYVFQPQWWFVQSGDAPDVSLVDNVFKAEQMDEVAAFLRDTTGTPISIGRINASDRDRDYRRYYTTPKLTELVGQLYARDVAAFGYEF